MLILVLTYKIVEPLTKLYRRELKTINPRIRHKNKHVESERRNQGKTVLSKIDRHLALITSAADNSKFALTKGTFYALSGSLLVVVLLVSVKTAPLNMAVFLAVVTSLIPYIYLRMVLMKVQIRGSYEGKEFVGRLIQTYRAKNYNILTTLGAVLPKLDDLPISKKSIYKLNYRINEHRNEEELQFAFDEFIYSTDTNWARMLADNLMAALKHDYNVSLSFEDIYDQFDEMKTDKENEKRNRRESLYFIYMTPISFLGGYLILMKAFGYRLDWILFAQLNNSGSIIVLLLMVLCFMFSIIGVIMRASSKFDL